MEKEQGAALQQAEKRTGKRNRSQKLEEKTLGDAHFRQAK